MLRLGTAFRYRRGPLGLLRTARENTRAPLAFGGHNYYPLHGHFTSTRALGQPQDEEGTEEPAKRRVGFFDRERSVAGDGFNRWLAVPAGT